jgi:hypothetical protein
VSHPIPTEVRPRKYRNVPTVVEGIRFASKAEAKRYVELRWLERAGEVSGLELQKRYPLVGADGIKVAVYVADFDYLNPDGEPVTEDVKGVQTPEFKLKSKLFEAQYGRKITIIGSHR